MSKLMQASSIKYQEKLRQAKDQFLEYKNIDSILLPPLLLKSWEYCRKLKLNQTILPQVTQTSKKNTIKNINSFKKYTIKYFHTLYEYLGQTLQELGAAMLFIDHNLYVYHKEGDSDLLAELKEKNISFGTRFSEEEVGTNAITLSEKTQSDFWVIGQQHYNDAFSDYVCFAHKSIKTITGLNDYTLLIIPCSKFNIKIYRTFQYICETHCQLTNFQMLPQVALTTNVLEQYLEGNHAACIIFDSNDQVIFTNKYFNKLFKKRIAQTIGSKLSELLPEIIPYLPSITSINKSKFENQSIIFNSLKENTKSFILDYQPIYIGNEEIGKVVILTEKDHMAKQINKIANSGTFFTVDDIIGKSPEMLHMKEMIKRTAKTDSNILITGESGTGKEMVAQSIHNASYRIDQPFISVNCAAIPKELIESELFGYSEGAFTGAKKSGSPGKFELADQGTLFLDEIGDMPINMQTVLLRVLENSTITRLGGSTPIKVNVRLIAATNCNLWDLVEKNLFRMDLYFRLNVVNIQTIPLRKLTMDLPILIQHFLSIFSSQYSKKIEGISDDVLNLFKKYPWPGNMRELRNVMERITIFNDSSFIDLEDIPNDLFIRMNHNELTIPSKADITEQFQVQQTFSNYSDYEKQKILNLLAKYKGNKSTVAQELGVTRRTLYSKIKKYNI